MNDAVYIKLRELSWRGKLTDAEEAELRAYLAARPEAQADWKAEAGLTQVLDRLPDVPVASNFTARVLQAAERETVRAARARRTPTRLWWRSIGWLPKAACTVLVVGLGLFAHHLHGERVEWAKSVMAVSRVKSLPRPEILEDFEVINRLTPMPAADQELLALMQ